MKSKPPSSPGCEVPAEKGMVFKDDDALKRLKRCMRVADMRLKALCERAAALPLKCRTMLHAVGAVSRIRMRR